MQSGVVVCVVIHVVRFVTEPPNPLRVNLGGVDDGAMAWCRICHRYVVWCVWGCGVLVLPVGLVRRKSCTAIKALAVVTVCRRHASALRPTSSPLALGSSVSSLWLLHAVQCVVHMCIEMHLGGWVGHTKSGCSSNKAPAVVKMSRAVCIAATFITASACDGSAVR